MDHNTETQRSTEDVEMILHYAKLGAGDVLPRVQCLSFVNNMDNDALKLLEVDQEILETLNRGEVLTIRGEKGDGAILCSNNKTYDLREAETSNNMLLLPECSLGSDLENEENRTLVQRKVIAMKQDYFELRPIRPRLKRLKYLLQENVFAGKEAENDEQHKGRKYTFEELQDVVQASDDELIKGLQQVDACHINGHWRLLDSDFVDSVLTNVLATAEENSMEFTSINPFKICAALQEIFPRNLVERVIQIFSNEEVSLEDFKESQQFKEDVMVALDEDKMCRFVAANFLKLNEKYNLNEFEKVWQAAVPSGMRTALYQLEGMVLIDQDSQTPVIRYFPAFDLPESVEERFNALFKTKAKWSMEEIKPFIVDLTTEKMSVGVLLTKYARASTQGGTKVYNSRKLLT